MKCARYRNDRLGLAYRRRPHTPQDPTTWVYGTIGPLFESSRFRQLEAHLGRSHTDENTLQYNQEFCTIKINAGRQAGHTIAAFEFARAHTDMNFLILYIDQNGLELATQKYVQRYSEFPPRSIRMATWNDVQSWIDIGETDYHCIIVDNADEFLGLVGQNALVDMGNTVMHRHNMRHYILLG